jgi:hypothetical protein
MLKKHNFLRSRKSNEVTFFTKECNKSLVIHYLIYLFMLLENQRFIFVTFSSVAPHRGQPQPSAISSGNPPGDWQSAMGWGDAMFELGTAGKQSGALPLNHHASH